MLNNPVGTLFTANATEAISPRQRLHLHLLGVSDVAASRQFYEALGWSVSPTGHSGFEKIDLGGYALCLINKHDLASDMLGADYVPSTEKNTLPFFNSAKVYVAQHPEDVAAILAKAESAGGKIIKPAQRTPWGIAGYFCDLDGHVFEVDYEEIWVLDKDDYLVVDEINERTC